MVAAPDETPPPKALRDRGLRLRPTMDVLLATRHTIYPLDVEAGTWVEAVERVSPVVEPEARRFFQAVDEGVLELWTDEVDIFVVAVDDDVDVTDFLSKEELQALAGGAPPDP